MLTTHYCVSACDQSPKYVVQNLKVQLIICKCTLYDYKFTTSKLGTCENFTWKFQKLKESWLLTSPPNIASSWKLSVQETLASSTSSPSFSKASSMETSKFGEFFSEYTLIRKPFSRASTVTC